METHDALIKQHPFLICVDSDGCVFDVMEIKHKECFCPAYIEYFSLQAVSRYARDAWVYVNLYSRYRGVHRLKALLLALDALASRNEVMERRFTPPCLPNLRAYIQAGLPLNNDGLEAYLQAHPEADDIQTVLAWSREVNRRVGQMVHSVPPFPNVRECLSRLSAQADIVTVSATQQKALEREWKEHGLFSLISAVRGQESGTKSQIIRSLAGAYAPGHVLMVGDAPGDLEAANDNQALFYPICPDQEAASWREFPEYAELFLGGKYAGAKQQTLTNAFLSVLPEEPFWTTHSKEQAG